MKKNILISVLVFISFCMFYPSIIYANEITKNTTILLNESNISSKVLDDNEATYIKISNEDVIEISSDTTICGLYIIYEIESKTGIIEANEKNIKIGENGFIHEYIGISNKIENVKELTIKYDANVKISDIYVFDEGTLPDFVEIWEKPCEKADIMLFSTHADDEQLFFLGLLPTYVAKGANVQVVYFTHHANQTIRYHEQLHGLYTVGVRHYPIIGIVPDAYSTTLNGAIQNMEKSGIPEEDVQKFQVEIIRRFKPQVIVGHDEKGEYSHGQHILNTHLLKNAIQLSNDENYDVESLNKYGKWNILKLYLHLYDKNKIVMDYDTPLEYFDGKTAYEVSKEGYGKHKTQHWTWFTKWMKGNNNSYTKATDIQTYSPVEFGLYYTSIEEDKNKNDFLENIVLYSQQEKIEKEKVEEITNVEKQDVIEKDNIDTVFLNKIGYICIIIVVITCLVIIVKNIIKK